MERRTVQIEIAGQQYRIISSATEDELRVLSEMVNEKLEELPSKPGAPNLLLAALALANELNAERQERAALASRTRAVLQRTLGRLNAALQDSQLKN